MKKYKFSPKMGWKKIIDVLTQEDIAVIKNNKVKESVEKRELISKFKTDRLESIDDETTDALYLLYFNDIKPELNLTDYELVLLELSIFEDNSYNCTVYYKIDTPRVLIKKVEGSLI